MNRVLALAFCVLSLAVPSRAEAPDVAKEIPRLLDGLDHKVAVLREQAAKNPQLGLDQIADQLEARAAVLHQASYSKGWSLIGEDAAYVSLGNKIFVTDNFFKDNVYTDDERLAVLLHESVHLDQGLWNRRFKFWGPNAEVPAYEDEYKWLNVLGVGKATGKFEVLNALQALREYGVIKSDDQTAELEKRLGLTPEQIAFLNPKPQAPTLEAESHDNAFYSFQLPKGWKVDFASDEARKRYVFMTKEVEKLGNMGITVTLGVRMTLGEVLGADYFDPGIEKLRADEIKTAGQFNFSGAKIDVTAKDSTLAGLPAAGMRKTETTKKEKQPDQVMVTEKYFFKKDRVYLYLELYYDQKHAKPLEAGAGMLRQSLVVK
jgi:hypothetical protein